MADIFDVTIIFHLKNGMHLSPRPGLGKPSIAIDRSMANSSAVDRKYF